MGRKVQKVIPYLTSSVSVQEEGLVQAMQYMDPSLFVFAGAFVLTPPFLFVVLAFSDSCAFVEDFVTHRGSCIQS